MAKRLSPVLILPMALFLFIPIMVVSWTYFYGQQKKALAAAQDPATSAEALEELGEDGNLDVKLQVALNPSTPNKTIEALAKDPTLRYYLIFEHDAPSPVVEAVAVDEKSKKPMLMAAARHHNASVAALDALSGHPDPEVRAEVARNPRVRQEILNRLAGDESEAVAHAARETLESRRPTHAESSEDPTPETTP